MRTQIVVRRGARLQVGDFVENGRDVIALVDVEVQAQHPDVLAPQWRVIPIEGGEQTKSFAALERLLRQMVQMGLDRNSVLVAIGGGTVGDLGGLAASLYLRGIDLIQVPTTLLAMLDSSVGGKTAINLPEGKNLVGTFWPARAMLADVEFLQTLPEAHLRSGLAEAIKMGIGFDPVLFDLLESRVAEILDGDPDLLAEVVRRAVDAKIVTVDADPEEKNGRRRCLNLGHTLAHALEAESDYSLLHGLAVAQGLHFCLDVATARGVLDDGAAQRSRSLLLAYGFTRTPWPAVDRLKSYFARDKKLEGGRLHFVVPTGIGSCRTEALAVEQLLGS